ncbi:MAG: hypothetical protein ACI4XJ_05975 [Eubacteriales bacterium]
MKYYAKIENGHLLVGNPLIERSVLLTPAYPASEYILDKRSGKYWHGEVGKAMFNIFGLTFSEPPRFSTRISDNGGLSESHLCAELVWRSASPHAEVTQTFEVYDDSPFINCFMTVSGSLNPNENEKQKPEKSLIGVESDSSAATPNSALPPADTIDYLPLSDAHLKIEALTLFDRTDGCDNYVSSRSEEVYAAKVTDFEGSIFMLTPNGGEDGLMLVKEAPCTGSQLCRKQSDLFVKPRKGGCAYLVGSGISADELSETPLPLYGSTVGVGRTCELKRLWRRHYGKVYLGGGSLFAMSNTWGDRSRDTALCEEFMLRERELAERIGIDVMQLDDGWQRGRTANSGLKKSGGVWTDGFYKDDPCFWDVDPEKFKSGLTPLMSDKVGLALWFSADGDCDYASHSRDANRLCELSGDYGVKQFKLDGTILKNKLCEKNLIDFLTEAHDRSGVTFNLDITSGVRLGYLVHKEIGTIFVENRYTDWMNYYPHAVLKNLWQLSELFPARKFQFELLNNLRNSDKYESLAPGDELAPANYDIDWLFASVMAANPLLWMEMQHLNEEQIKKLASIVEIWKRERDKLYAAEVEPIGSLPDGYSFTGFNAKIRDGGYLILLRESGEAEFSYVGISSVEVLASTGGFEYALSDGRLSVSFKKPRSYAFLKYTALEK